MGATKKTKIDILIAALAFMSLVADVTTHARLAKLITPGHSYYIIVIVGVLHLVLTIILTLLSKSITARLYLLATILGFLLISCVTPLGAILTAGRLLF